jgi:hypothetical protein
MVSAIHKPPKAKSIREAVEQLVASTHPGAVVEEIHAFGIDTTVGHATSKAAGYGKPLLVTVREQNGTPLRLVLHTASANVFGHDRRADRAADMLLAYDTFGDIPNHVRAVDVGAIAKDGSLVSLDSVGEFFVLTGYAEGDIYADDLRRIGRERVCSPIDVERARQLGHYLADLHVPTTSPASVYTRSIRDLVGSGEGIFGIIDGYPEDNGDVSREQLMAIERACVEWRWRLNDADRLTLIHGDFHPFNVLFTDASLLSLLDASRGSRGDPADDLTAMAINYVFFALQAEGSWERGFGPLWRSFWTSYFERREDDGLLASAPPFWAWRSLVLANPKWYPDIDKAVRQTLLDFAEQALASAVLDLGLVEELFA